MKSKFVLLGIAVVARGVIKGYTKWGSTGGGIWHKVGHSVVLRTRTCLKNN